MGRKQYRYTQTQQKYFIKITTISEHLRRMTWKFVILGSMQCVQGSFCWQDEIKSQPKTLNKLAKLVRRRIVPQLDTQYLTEDEQKQLVGTNLPWHYDLLSHYTITDPVSYPCEHMLGIIWNHAYFYFG